MPRPQLFFSRGSFEHRRVRGRIKRCRKSPVAGRGVRKVLSTGESQFCCSTGSKSALPAQNLIAQFLAARQTPRRAMRWRSRPLGQEVENSTRSRLCRCGTWVIDCLQSAHPNDFPSRSFRMASPVAPANTKNPPKLWRQGLPPFART